MLDDVFVMGAAAYVTELLKQRGLRKEWVPLVVLALAAALNVLNAVVFDPSTPWREALKAGLMLGAVAGGVYGFGQSVKRGQSSGEALP